MHLGQRASYLVVHDAQSGQRRRAALLPTFEDILTGWTAGSRVSPVWHIAQAQGYDFAEPNLTLSCDLLFLGPVRPIRLTTEVERTDKALAIWATLGCFNLIVQCGADKEGQDLAQRLIKWASAESIPHEHWVLEDGVITSTSHRILVGGDAGSLLSLLTKYAESYTHPAVKCGFQELLVATASSLTRAAGVCPWLFNELAAITDANAQIMEKYSKDELKVLEMQSRLLTMNAALSRFSSQAFSGVPPILSTECHFWIHSLLGTGSANIALASVVGSIQKVLGEARLPERLQALSQITKDVPDASQTITDHTLLSFDILRKTDIAAAQTQPVIPLVTYFSGRDGFSSHVQTLSAPLTALAECNSLRSNLLTVTHEISHIFVQSALAELCPTPGIPEQFACAHRLLAPHYQAKNMLEAAQKLFLEAVAFMAAEERGGTAYSHRELGSELPGIVERTRAEVQEILVHTFDFLYFNAGDPAYYIKNIWHSWCAIPGISDRVPEYLMRTLCAVSSNLLLERPNTRFPAALRFTKQTLESVQPQTGIPNSYVDQVLAYINRIENDRELYIKTSRNYGVRLRLVQLVKIFLFSEELAAQLFHDPYIGGGEGYKTKKPLIYDLSRIGNALQFLRTLLKANPTEAESMWILHALAFDLSAPPFGAP